MSHEISRRSELGAGLAATGAALAGALPATGANAATRASSALELGCGWLVNLTTKYGDQVDMYVDYVRVYSS